MSGRKDSYTPPTCWQVQVNGVGVGRITVAQREALRTRVRKDPSVWFSQFSNTVSVLIRSVLWLLALPWLYLLGLLTIAIFDPTLPADVTLAQMLSVPHIKAYVLSAFGVGIVSFLIYGVVHPSGLARLVGFRNCFGQALDDAVRRFVHCPATGDVYLFDDRALTTQTSPSAPTQAADEPAVAVPAVPTVPEAP